MDAFDVSDRNDICDQIDDLITSVDAMRWRPESAGSDVAEPDDVPSPDSATWVPADCKARFDALYETINAFAGAVDDRMQAFATRVEGSFDSAAEPDASTTTNQDRR